MKKFIIYIILMITILAGLASAPLFLHAAISTSEGTSTPKEIALTFDDGPYGTSTKKVLSILEKEHVSATFFIIGKNAEKYPSLVKQIINDGDVIGNHSYDHSTHLSNLPEEKFEANLNEAESTIATISNTHPRLFRAPYGKVSPKMKQALASEGYTLVRWTVDPTDWNAHISSQQIIDSVVNNTTNHSIILLHDGRDTHINYPRNNMLDALATIIERLKKEHYTFVTVDKLLNKPAYFR